MAAIGRAKVNSKCVLNSENRHQIREKSLERHQGAADGEVVLGAEAAAVVVVHRAAVLERMRGPSARAQRSRDLSSRAWKPARARSSKGQQSDANLRL